MITDIEEYRMRVCWGLAVAVTILFGSLGTAWADRPEVRRVHVVDKQGEAKIVIKGNFEAPSYSVRATNNGRAVIIDVDGVSLPDNGLMTDRNNTLVSRTVASSTAKGVRIELSLTKSVTYHARADKNTIVVRLNDGQGAVESPRSKRRETGTIRIDSVHVERRDGRDRVIIELNKEAPFRVSTRAGSAPRLEVLGAVVCASSRSLASDSTRKRARKCSGSSRW